MRHNPLGTSDLSVSVVGLGCNNFGSRLDLDGTRAVVDAAIDAGVTFFDTADMYGNQGGSESLLGEVLEGRRDQVVLATKFGHQRYDMGYSPDLGPKGGASYVRHAVEQSLRRLRTDHIDLYQLHTPDPQTPIAETLEVLDELVREGKVLHIGHSNLSAAEIDEAADASEDRGLARFVSAQDHWSLLERDVEAEVVPAARRRGVGVIPYFPLANGLLTGKVRRGAAIPEGTRVADRAEDLVTEERLDTIEALAGWAEQRGRTVLDVAIGWLASQPSVASVIAGATRPEQVRANAAAGEWLLTADEIAEVDRLTR
jgi:aryl-alcohol dehydrogenase-like predicted oxidoreductase